ncbi:MAG: glycosyltransferase [Dorea sp.]|jgi:glycosyltransferase involved in cell wall biosynthesis|nr:glycosyltransferase [Dorea sp.]
MIKVSIIIPVYNVQDYLEECMKSVLAQTLENIEIICVNDGSTDRSSDILKRFQSQDGRIILLDQENRGYGYAMNRGIAAAVGEYIGIVEPDDYIVSDMYQELYDTAEKYQLDFVKADFYRFTTREDGEREFYYNHLSQKQQDYNKVFNPSKDADTLRYIMNTWSGIYKRKFLEKNQIWHNETSGASFQDNGFWFQTFVYGERAMIIDKPYYRNRRDNPDSSVNSKEKVYCINIEYDYIRSILIKKPEIWERFKYMYWFKKYHNYMGTLWRIKEEYRKGYIYRFSQELKRGIALSEVKKDVFSETAWNHIQSMTEDPEKYYWGRVYPKSVDEKIFARINELEIQNSKLKNEIARLRCSKSFRLGRLLLCLPIKLKKMAGGYKI